MCARVKNRCKPPSAALYRSPRTNFPGAIFCCNTPKGVHVSPCLGVWLVPLGSSGSLWATLRKRTAQMPTGYSRYSVCERERERERERRGVMEAFLSSVRSHTPFVNHMPADKHNTSNQAYLAKNESLVLVTQALNMASHPPACSGHFLFLPHSGQNSPKIKTKHSLFGNKVAFINKSP
ncbi:hypothetical protein BDP81DRAFT_120074 [Colletotrichum phormii]|uniref:Uncharacterized protein n=1 Tax=Colletotrichum phormii TaxID=359342 RepID=A0AAI9ZFK3_9PEZI|nr:uncharacterized protein BDP81DRAFT_120074 [Colletotrichum phormii]KAK1623637.1 hypothetical protein BDP81DRAFT_120074 [Colletotrichum phormii]